MAWRTTCAVLLLLLARCAVSVDRFPPVLSSILLNNEGPSLFVVSSFVDNTFSCRSEGGTPIYWSVPPAAQSLVTTAGVLTLPKKAATSQVDYGGEYYCFTNNTLGTAASSIIRLQIGVVTLDPPDPVLSISANAGDTVILTCNSTAASAVVRPDLLNMDVTFIWYWQSLDTTSGFGRTDFIQKYSLIGYRIALDENNRLFIRNVQSKDFDSANQRFIGCRTLPGPHTKFESDIGKYSLSVTGTPSTPITPKLIYKTGDVTATEGYNFTLVCIFNDVNGSLDGAVTWNNAFDVSFENGARGKVVKAGQQHAGDWVCSYKGITGTIKVTVRRPPRVDGVRDTFATVGSAASFTCSFQWATSIRWYKNNVDVNLVRVDIKKAATSEVMTIRDVEKGDIGVYSCEARNDVTAIRVNGRLIVTDPTIGNASVYDGSKYVGTEAIVDVNTTSIKIGCMFTADPLISSPSIIWRMQQLSADIDGTKDFPEFGISKANVITQAAAKPTSILTIQVVGDSAKKVIGNVSCILVYTILDSAFNVSANRIEIKEKAVYRPPETLVVAQFPYWIIGVIIAALFLILLVFLIIFCVQRNKGEQYYVDEKERKAGHDPKEELPPWQEFNRPDQDPVKGSRASLEMEDRPMGSDAGSMDEYGVDTDTGKFNEDGSFIGQYGPKGQRPGASGQV